MMSSADKEIEELRILLREEQRRREEAEAQREEEQRRRKKIETERDEEKRLREEAESRSEEEQRRREEEQRRREEEQRRREETERDTTLPEFLQGCHDYLHNTMTIQTNPTLSTQGTTTNVKDKVRPLCLSRWTGFLESQKLYWDEVYGVHQ